MHLYAQTKVEQHNSSKRKNWNIQLFHSYTFTKFRRDDGNVLFKNWMSILVLLCENECQRWDASRCIKAHSEAQRFYVYRDASHLWHSFSHNRTKINIQNL